MAVSLDLFLPEVRLDVPDASYPVLINAVRNAAIEFCKRSRYWKYDLDAITAVADTSEYTITVPADAVVSRVLSVRYNGEPLTEKTPEQLDVIHNKWRTETGDPSYFYLSTPRKIRIAPYPTTGATLYDIEIAAALKPDATATTIEDFVYEDYHEAIAAGAAARLMIQPKKTWTDPQGAAIKAALFESGILAAQREADDNYSPMPRQTSYGGI